MRRYDSKRLYTGSETVCAICQQPLAKGEIGNVRRCKACRMKAPGRPDPQTVVQPTVAPVKDSVWLNAPQDGFTARMAQHSFKPMHRPGLSMRHTGFSDGLV